MSDTIAAIATGNVLSAIGILRLSGPRAIEVAQASFRPLNKVPLSQHRPHELVYGDLLDRSGSVIDHVLTEMGRAGTEMLIDLIERKAAAPVVRSFSPLLRTGQTVAPPRKPGSEAARAEADGIKGALSVSGDRD